MAAAEFNLENVTAAVRIRCADPSTQSRTMLSEPDLISAVLQAIVDHSRDLPASLIAEFPGTAAQHYPLLTSLPSYLEGFSGIRWVEYPAILSSVNEPPVYLESGTEWTVQEAYLSTVRTLYLFFPLSRPLASELIRVSYTGFHTIKGLGGITVSTILPAHQEAFCDLVASKALRLIATQMSFTSQPTMGVSVIEHTTAADRIMARSREYLASYQKIVSGGDMGQTPAFDQFLDWNTRMAWGQQWMFHNQPTRQLPG